MAANDSEPYQSKAVLVHRLSSSAETAVDPDFGQEARVWPVATVPLPVEPPYPTSCVVIAGAEAVQLVAALAEANEVTPWLIGTDPPSRMAFRPLLPGDLGC